MTRWWSTFENLVRADGLATLYGLAFIAVLTLVECVRPAEPGQSMRGRGRNLLFLVQLKTLGLATLAGWYAFGPRIPVDRVEVEAGLSFLLIVLNLFAIDLFYYVYHRAQHGFRPLWAIHELHHADAELNATSSYRTYWLEAPVQTVLVVTPTALVFGHFGPDHGRLVMAASLFFLILSHANVRLDLGPLTDWIIGPQVHRVHHSRLHAHRDCNFAQTFPLIDRLFGTYHRPERDECPPTGAEDLASDASLSVAMVQPFRIWSGWRPSPVAETDTLSEGTGS